MKKFFIKHEVLLIILANLFLYIRGFSAYFYQDDFINISFSQKLNQVILALNIFQHGEYPFYRPFSTQIYFYFLKFIFDLHPLGYHVVNFIIFSVNIFLVYKLVMYLCRNKYTATVSAIIYSFNSTHIAPLYSASNVQELLLVLFNLLSILNFFYWIERKNSKFLYISIGSFILALMSKESAVALPAIISMIYFLFKKTRSLKNFSVNLFPYFLVLGIYLFAHYYYYGLAISSSYKFIIGKQNLNILVWYFLWSLSAPNILVDFVGPGLQLNKVFWEVGRYNAFIFLILFPLFLILGLILILFFLRNYKKYSMAKLYRVVGLGMVWFVIGIMPLIFFPLHKLATEQAFSLVGLAIVVGIIVTLSPRYLSTVFMLIFIFLTVNSILLASRTHWVIMSGEQAAQTFKFITNQYPNIDDSTIVYFKNGTVKIPEYGSSRQIYQALGNGVGINLILNKRVQAYFEDINPLPDGIKNRHKIVEIDSSQLLGY